MDVNNHSHRLQKHQLTLIKYNVQRKCHIAMSHSSEFIRTQLYARCWPVTFLIDPELRCHQSPFSQPLTRCWLRLLGRGPLGGHLWLQGTLGLHSSSCHYRGTKPFLASSSSKNSGQELSLAQFESQGLMLNSHSHMLWLAWGRKSAQRKRSGFPRGGKTSQEGKNHTSTTLVFFKHGLQLIRGEKIVKLLQWAALSKIKKMKKDKTEQNQIVPNSIPFCETSVLITCQSVCVCVCACAVYVCTE